MKNAVLRFAYLSLVLLKLSVPLYSQGKSEITFGIGFPEMSNVKFKYGADFQVGAGLGFIPLINFLTISGEIYYNFHPKPESTNPDTWYINAGLTLLNIIQEWEDERDLFLYSRFGRRFYFKKGGGLNLDLGIGLLAGSNESSSSPLGGSGGLSLPGGSSKKPGPVGSISYFIDF